MNDITFSIEENRENWVLTKIPYRKSKYLPEINFTNEKDYNNNNICEIGQLIFISNLFAKISSQNFVITKIYLPLLQQIIGVGVRGIKAR